MTRCAGKFEEALFVYLFRGLWKRFLHKVVHAVALQRVRTRWNCAGALRRSGLLRLLLSGALNARAIVITFDSMAERKTLAFSLCLDVNLKCAEIRYGKYNSTGLRNEAS